SGGDPPAWKKVAMGPGSEDLATPERPMEPPFRTGPDDKRVVGPARFLADGKEDTAWAPDRGPGRRNGGSVAVVRFKDPAGFPGRAETSVLHLARRRPEDARETFVLDRGAWDRPKVKVAPGVPAAFHPLPRDARPDRLALARWLADRNSPTTARVAVNRAW